MQILAPLFARRKKLPLSGRQAECVEDGLLWALTCVAQFAPPPVRAWVANNQNSFRDAIEVAPNELASSAEIICGRLGLTQALGNTEAQNSADAALHVSSCLIAKGTTAPPVWWSGTSKAAHMLAMVMGLGLVFGGDALANMREFRQVQLLSDEEIGYGLALISEYAGVEPRRALEAADASVRASYWAGLAHLNRNQDLREDLAALTLDYDRSIPMRFVKN